MSVKEAEVPTARSGQSSGPASIGMDQPLYAILQGTATSLPFPDRYFDLVIGSPPYGTARAYEGIPVYEGEDWADWMVSVTSEALRVCNGPVLWVCSGTGGLDYVPLPELLVSNLWQRGVRLFRPCVWVKNAPPCGRRWFSNDWEFVIAAHSSDRPPYWDPEALEIPLKYKSGGAFRQRRQDGTRSQGSEYPTHEFRRRPSNVIHATVGGGHMGHPLATENEAPFPESLVEPFIKVLCPPTGVVLDPFCGSGSTLATALKLGRGAVGIDIRESQVELARRRIAEEVPHARLG